MRTVQFIKNNRLRLLPIYLGISLSLPLRADEILVHTNEVSSPASMRVVKNCNDAGADSLRAAITPAADGDTIVFDVAAMSCSRISLTTGEISAPQNDLFLQGSKEVKITVSGEGQSRILDHTGNGVLAVYDLAISDGHYSAAGKSYGGCVHSAGSVWLNSATVDSCTAESQNAYAFGGGISAAGDIQLLRSRVSHGKTAGNPSALGGGLFSAGSIVMTGSSVEYNDAGPGGSGGGISSTSGDITLDSSTIDHNMAAFGSAISHAGGGTVEVVNSTVSDNEASGFAAIEVLAARLNVRNSTIAFNHDASTGQLGAVYFYGVGSPSSVKLDSSIIARNTSGVSNVPADLYVVPGPPVALDGADNLIIATTPLPLGVVTVTADPQLGPLQFNGGFTRTRALQVNSLARGMGNNLSSLSFDQRGVGYVRSDATATDMGAVQFDRIFVDSFEDL